MQVGRNMLLCAATGLVAVLLQGCGDDGLGTPGADHSGQRVDTDLVSALCSDATHKNIASSGLVHEHLVEIEDECKTKSSDADLKRCEDEKIAGIERAKDNITSFYIEHCRGHVVDDLEGEAATLELAHPAADKFESSHKTEMTNELHEQMHLEMAKNMTGPFTTPEVLCLEEIGKNIEADDDLVHNHLEEIEQGCKGKENLGDCEFGAVRGIINAKGTLMTKYVDHCLHPATWTLHAIHPAIDKFGEVHVAEVKADLHRDIHTAMASVGLESTTPDSLAAKFATAPKKGALVNNASVPLIVGATALASVSALVLAGVFSLRRRSMRNVAATAAMLEQDEEATGDVAVANAE